MIQTLFSLKSSLSPVSMPCCAMQGDRCGLSRTLQRLLLETWKTPTQAGVMVDTKAVELCPWTAQLVEPRSWL